MLRHTGTESALGPLWMGFFFGCYTHLALEGVDDFIFLLIIATSHEKWRLPASVCLPFRPPTQSRLAQKHT